jgi:aspartate carbamoyltransferase catalytic subunit
VAKAKKLHCISSMHVLSSEQFSPEMLEDIFNRAQEFEQHVGDDDYDRELAARYAGKLFFNIFYEPSTRTRVSFGAAARRLGFHVEQTENAKEFSSAAKGETIEDTVRVLNEYYPSIITIRHHETGTLARAAAVSRAPIFNAGDGKGEHPTQALLDAYTIQSELGRLSGLNVVMGGDMANGRTARSLAKLLSKYQGNHITFVSVPELQMKDDVLTVLDENQTTHESTVEMYDALRMADVVYWTRIQRERLDNPDALPEKGFVIDQSALEVMKKQAIIMHPLPRVDEITVEVDDDPRAVYFKQAGNGMFVRMALIDMVMKEEL